jgi:hypothetical protein
VPTGIGAEIGGHSGDGCVLSKLLGSVSDRVITHPNVVNAADINEMPENTLYVEGSILSRFLMGTLDLQTVRSNRVLFIADKHKHKHFNNIATNSINAARVCYGFSCPNIVELSPSVELKAKFTKEGRAIGTVKNIERIMQTLDSFKGEFDALAIATVIQLPKKFEYGYFKPNATFANPWGGVEAIFTHTISMLYNIPAAHSPMKKTEEEVSYDPGVIDPRKAAEMVSLSFLQCILKGLQRSPRIIPSTEHTSREGILNVCDVSCLVIPDGCVGLPTLAALEQGIPVIAIRNNYNLMRNNLSDLPWAPGQFYMAENYLEAAGIIGAMRAGITLDSMQRPIASAKVSSMKFNK